MSAALVAAVLGDARRVGRRPAPPHRPNFRGGTSLIDNRAIGVALGGQVKRLVVARAAKRVREALPHVSMVEAIGAG
jgi:hypothetical protein